MALSHKIVSANFMHFQSTSAKHRLRSVEWICLPITLRLAQCRYQQAASVCARNTASVCARKQVTVDRCTSKTIDVHISRSVGLCLRSTDINSMCWININSFLVNFLKFDENP